MGAPALDVLARLGDALAGEGDAAPAAPGDEVDGVPAAVRARPTTVAATSRLLAAAHALSLVTVVRGGGTALDHAAPPRHLDLLLDLTGLDRVVEHAPADMVLVAQAGARLADLLTRVGGSGQELLSDLPAPRVAAGSTLGGAIATRATGPRRVQRLPLRDTVLGATVVLADGTVARSGGKVVKNVAGYDLAKLMTGSVGTLAVVVEAAVRLTPRRDAAAWVLWEADPVDAAARARALLDSQLAVAAVELDRPAGGAVVGGAALLEGGASSVRARAERAAELVGGTLSVEAPPWWGTEPAGADGRSTVLLRTTATHTGVRHVLAAAAEAEARHGVAVAVRGSATGVLAVALEAGRPPDRAHAVGHVLATLRGAVAHPGDGTTQVVRAPADVWAAVDAWGPVPGLELMRAIKDRFDPGGVLAPGRFVGGI